VLSLPKLNRTVPEANSFGTHSAARTGEMPVWPAAQAEPEETAIPRRSSARMPIPLIPPPDSEGIRHPVPIQVARVFRLIPPPLVGA